MTTLQSETIDYCRHNECTSATSELKHIHFWKVLLHKTVLQRLC